MAELTGDKLLCHRHNRNLLADTISPSIPAVTTLRSSLRMYVFLYIINCFLIICFVDSSPEVTFRITLVFQRLVDLVRDLICRGQT
jgi:hypothetical protein